MICLCSRVTGLSAQGLRFLRFGADPSRPDQSRFRAEGLPGRSGGLSK